MTPAVPAHVRWADEHRTRTAGGEAYRQCRRVHACELRKGVVRWAGDDFGAKIQEHQQVPEVAGEEGQLVLFAVAY